MGKSSSKVGRGWEKEAFFILLFQSWTVLNDLHQIIYGILLQPGFHVVTANKVRARLGRGVAV